MKSIFLSILLSLGLLSNATTYYFSNTVAYSGAATGDVAHPFRNPSAMDSILKGIYPGITSVAGDQFLFNRRDIFPLIGTITPNRSGTTTKPYIIGAYGTGNKPVFTSFQEVKNWTSMGGNKYRAPIPGNGTMVTSLLLGSTPTTTVFQPIGRWPNRNATSNNPVPGTTNTSWGGYMDLETVGAGKTTNIATDDDYTTEANTRPTDSWVGAELSIRNAHFRYVKKKIASAVPSGTSMSYTLVDPEYFSTAVGGAWGYFFQNHIACLDQQGEWAYDGTKDSVYIYLINSPTNYSIQVPTVQRVFDFGNNDYYVVDNIEIWGSNESIIYSGFSGTGINITNCNLIYGGENAIQFMSGGHFIDGNYIDYALTKGIETYSGNCTITNNIIKNTMPVNGMNYNANAQGSAIDAYGDGVYVAFNRIFNSAYCAIDVNNGSVQRVHMNYMDSGNVRIDDGGVIYTVNQDANYTYRDKVIDSNILLHTWLSEAYIGLPRIYNKMGNIMAQAIYGDKWTDRWKIEGNILIDPYIALYLNDGFRDTVRNNIAYNFQKYGFQIHKSAAVTSTDPDVSGILATGNVYYSGGTGSSPLIAEAFDAEKAVTNTVPDNYGVFKDQYFIYPFFQTNDNYFRGPGIMNWSTWNSTFGYDATKNFFSRTNPSGSTTSNISKLIYNDKLYDSVVHLGGKTWIEPATGKEYLYDTAILPAFTGRVLIYTAKTVLPLANTPPQVSLTNPVNNAAYTAPAFIILQASASDADGTIASVKFYNNNVLLGSGTLSNGIYNYQWANVGAGPYALKAVATDNNGATTASGVSTIIVADPPSSYKASTDTYKTRGIKFYKKTK